MIAIDTNVLVAAHRGDHPSHRACEERVRRIVEDEAAWALPVFCIGEFLRVVTHPRVFGPPSPLEDALAFVESLLASPGVRVLSPGPRYWRCLARAMRGADARGNLAFDAQIAALCEEHGARELVTADRDFARFAGIRPLYV